jgi:hypothetical protein
MTKAEKVQYVVDELERLYPETPVPLDHKDPFTLLVAVVLECTVHRRARKSNYSEALRCGGQPLRHGQNDRGRDRCHYSTLWFGSNEK